MVFGTDELSTSIRIQNDGRVALALPQRHQDGLDHQLTILGLAHGPPDDILSMRIELNTKVQSALRGSTKGDVGYSLGVRLLGVEIPTKLAGSSDRAGIRHLLVPAPRLRDGLESVNLFHPGDSVLAADSAFEAQLVVHPRPTHDIATLLAQNSKPVGQCHISLCLGAQRHMPWAMAVDKSPSPTCIPIW